MWIEKIGSTVLDETHERQVEEIMAYSPVGRKPYTTPSVLIRSTQPTLGTPGPGKS